MWPWRGAAAPRSRARPRTGRGGRCCARSGATTRSAGPSAPPGVRDGGGSRPRSGSGCSTTWSEALRAAAHPALLVVLDDVHRADEPSLLVLRHLADRLADAPLLVLATFRDVEPADTLRRALPELLRAGAVERLDLRRFDLDDVRAQLADPREAERVLDVTGGNPLFVREVARAIADGMWRPDRPPATVREVVAARLERVSEPCRTLVRAAAVVGRDFPLGLVAATLEVPVVECLPAVDEAVAWGLVEELGSDYRFCHALTRDAVAASLTTAERAALHRRVAEAIVARNGSDLTDLAEHLPDLARHWAELAPFGEGATARRWALAAAEDAVGRLAYEEGVRLYRSALAVAEPRVDGGGAVPRARRAGPGRAAVRRPRGRGRGHAGGRPLGRHPAARGGGRARAGGRAGPERQRAGHAAVRGGAGRARRRRPRPAAGPPARPAQPPGVLRRRAGTGRGALRGRARAGPRGGRRRRAGQRAAGPAGGAPRAVRPGGAAARWAPRWSRSRRGWTARARRCGGGSGGSRR